MSHTPYQEVFPTGRGTTDCCHVLRLEVEQRLVGLHIDRHRDMLMRDLPGVCNLAEAHRHPHPRLCVFPRGPRTPDPVQAVTERHIMTHRDAHVAYLIV